MFFFFLLLCSQQCVDMKKNTIKNNSGSQERIQKDKSVTGADECLIKRAFVELNVTRSCDSSDIIRACHMLISGSPYRLTVAFYTHCLLTLFISAAKELKRVKAKDSKHQCTGQVKYLTKAMSAWKKRLKKRKIISDLHF